MCLNSISDLGIILTSHLGQKIRICVLTGHYCTNRTSGATEIVTIAGLLSRPQLADKTTIHVQLWGARVSADLLKKILTLYFFLKDFPQRLIINMFLINK